MAKTLDPMDLKQIIRLHLDGFSNREIGKALGIARNAVNNYMQRFKSCDKKLKELLELHNRQKGSMKIDHKAGHNMMIDFASKHLHITDKETGDLLAVEVFLYILPCSHYTC